jgi:hypothetical protein
MTYRGRKQGTYGSKRSRPPTNRAFSSTRIRKKTVTQRDWLRRDPRTIKTEDTQIFPNPEEVVNENKQVDDVEAGYNPLKAGFRIETGNKMKIEFPKERRKKIKGIDVV